MLKNKSSTCFLFVAKSGFRRTAASWVFSGCLLLLVLTNAAQADTIRLSDQPNPPQPPIGSAADLVGPDKSAAACHRQLLETWLSKWTSRSFTESEVSRRNAVNTVLDFLDLDATFWVEFDDGTKVRVVQHSTNNVSDMDRRNIDASSFHHVVEPATAQGPGLWAIPASPGQFHGFAYSGGAVGGLGRLALRLGVALEFGDGDGGGSCEGMLSCTPEGKPLRCETSLSRKHVEDC